MGFIQAFVEIFDINAAVAIIILSAFALFKMRRIGNGLLKARLFLNNAVIEQTWLYLSIAGASFALNVLIIFMNKIMMAGDMFQTYYIVSLTQLIFVIAFFMAVYNWCLFINHISPIKSG